tara:strand:+ start:123 stop:1118 length:996 start_codon:yes stop_codon:yes gene_type:complete
MSSIERPQKLYETYPLTTCLKDNPYNLCKEIMEGIVYSVEAKIDNMDDIEKIIKAYFPEGIQGITNTKLKSLKGIDEPLKNKLKKIKKKYNKDKKKKGNKDIMDGIVDEIPGTKTDTLIQTIKNISLHNSGSNTQLTGANHENCCFDIFKEGLSCLELDTDSFKNMLRVNYGYTTGVNFTKDPPETINITNINGLEYNKNYIIKQPFGPQNYPDNIVLRITDNIANILYIECKQPIPTWNNTPAKRCKHCIYICGNEIYNGSLIMTEGEQIHKNSFVQRYRDMIDEYNNLDTNIKIVAYKKIELRKWPTPYFRERQSQNIPLINETLSRFY